MALTKVGKEGITNISNSSDATAITIDSSENVGIGTTSPQVALHVEAASSSGKLRLSKGTVSSADDGVGSIQFRTGNTTAAANINGRTDASGTGNGALQFSTGTTSSLNERMRIDSSGNIMMGTTSVGGTSVLSLGSSNYMVATHNDGGTSGFFGQIRFRNNANNADVGTINRVNDASVQYNTSSDARLKENIADITGAITRVKQLSPKRYSWVNENLDAANQDGFLAHEAQTVVPIAVSGTQDEVDENGNPVYMQMDYSKLVPLLTGALKEAIAKIEALEARVTALEDA